MTALATANLYRLWWPTDHGPQHSPAMTYEHALRAYDSMVHHVTRYHHPVHLVTEDQFQQLVQDAKDFVPVVAEARAGQVTR